MKIFLNDIQIYAHHGVLPQEKTLGAQFRVSVEGTIMETEAAKSDQLSDTVSYADMAQVVSEEMSVPSQLLEHVCGRIGRRLLRDFPALDSVTVRVIKQNPPITGLQCNGAGVELTLTRESNKEKAIPHVM